jgi:hypothetical protein
MALKVWGAGSTQGSDGLWDTATNWDNDTAPVDGDSLLFDASALYGMTTGPSTSSVIIENIQITSDAIAPSLGGTYPLVVVGQLNSLSPSIIYVTIYPYGVTSVVGAWNGYVVYPTDKPVDPLAIAYLGISQVLFTSSNYLELNSFYGVISELKYGTSDVFLNVLGADSFTSFKINIQLSVFSLAAVSKISSQLIEFENVLLSINSGSNFELNSPLINITQMGSLINNMGGMTLTNVIFSQSCTLNVSASNTFYPNFINEGVIFNFLNSSVINLYGEATICGTLPSIGMGMTAAVVSLQGSTTINAYNNSLVAGLYSSNGFLDGYLGLFSSYPCNIYMRDNSVFQGMVMSGMGSSMTFLDSSNVSFNYQYDRQNATFQAYPSSVTVGGGDIPQSAGGLTIFKSSF